MSNVQELINFVSKNYVCVKNGISIPFENVILISIDVVNKLFQK